MPDHNVLLTSQRPWSWNSSRLKDMHTRWGELWDKSDTGSKHNDWSKENKVPEVPYKWSKLPKATTVTEPTRHLSAHTPLSINTLLASLFSISLKFFPKGTKARAVPPSRFRELRSHFKSPKPWPPNSSSKVVISVYLLLANSFEIISIYKISTSIMQSTPFILIFLDKDI